MMRALSLLAIIIMGVVINGLVAEEHINQDRMNLSKSSPQQQQQQLLQFNVSSLPLLPGGKKKKKKDIKGPTTSSTGSYATIPLQRVKQPSGWGMVGEILAGDDYDGLSYRVMFDPQVSSSFLFHQTMKRSGKWRKQFSKRSHFYTGQLSRTAKGESIFKNTWFELSLQDGSHYQGGVIADAIEIDHFETQKVNFGVVRHMNQAAATLRSGTFDGIIGLGFKGFADYDTTCMLDEMMDPFDIGGHLAKRAFSIYISQTGKTGEVRFGGTNPDLHDGPLKYYNIDLFLKTHHRDDQSSDSSIASSSIDSSSDESSPIVTVTTGDEDSQSSSDSTKYYDAQEYLDSGEESHPSEGPVLPALPGAHENHRHSPHEWMWGFNGDVTVGGKSVSASSDKKIKMAFSTLVPYGLVVHARNDYLSSSFHNAVLGSTNNNNGVELVSVGDGHAVKEAELLVLCSQRASLPQLTFKVASDEEFAAFNGEEYFPTVLTSGEVKKLKKVNKHMKSSKMGGGGGMVQYS